MKRMIILSLLGMSCMGMQAATEYVHAADTVKTDTVQSEREADRIVAQTDSIYKSMDMQEVVIEGKTVLRYPDKDVWIVTKELRKRAFNVNEMLGNIPGMYYDRFEKSLEYNGLKNIKILMDGKEKMDGYVGSLAHLRFKQVEITMNPQGHYQDYDVLVNLITIENYEGVEGLLNGNLTLAPKQEDIFRNVGPNGTLTYTRNKFNIAGYYGYNHAWSETKTEIQRHYPDYRLETIDEGKPQQSALSNNHSAWLDMDYDINKKHSVSARYSISHSSSKEFIDYLVHKEYDDPAVDETWRREWTKPENMGDNHAVTAYYRGDFSEWKLYGDFTYNHLKSNNRSYFDEEDGQLLDNRLHNTKDYTRLTLDASRTIKQKNRVNFGYVDVYQKYSTTNGMAYSSAKEYRDRAYASLYRSFTSNWNGSVSGNVELVRDRRMDNYAENQWLWWLSVNTGYFRYKDNRILRFNLGYSCSVSYPNQSQLNSLGYSTGYDVWVTGNPELKTNVSHFLNLNMMYKKLSVNAGLAYSPNQISSVTYENDEATIIQTYKNVNYLRPFGSISYRDGKVICDILNINYEAKVNYTYARYRLDEAGLESKRGDFTGHALLTFSLKKWRFTNASPSLTVQYNDGGYNYFPSSVQSRSRYGMKRFVIFSSAYFCANRLMLDLYYIIPTKWGGYNKTLGETITPTYQVYSQMDTFLSNQHQIQLRIQWMFAKGRQVKKKQNRQVTEGENNRVL